MAGSNPTDPELRPYWHRKPDEAEPKPHSLLDELIDDGSICKDFHTHDHHFRVSTKFHWAPNTRLFRCVVLRDGNELHFPPWTPIFHEVTAETAEPGSGTAARLTLARRALETHLATCARVARQLEGKGDLVVPPRRSPHVSVVLAAVSAALVAILIWRPWADREPNSATQPINTQPIAQPAQEISQENQGQPPKEEPMASPEPPSLEPPASLPRSAPSPLPQPSSQKTQERVTTRSQPPEPEVGTRLARQAPPKTPEPPPAAPDPVGAAPTRASREYESIFPWPQVLQVMPEDVEIVELDVGTELYRGHGIHVVALSSAFHGLRCAMAPHPQNNEDQTITIKLSDAANVIVAFDHRAKHRPDWLAGFRRTPEELAVTYQNGERRVVYDIYRKRFTTGIAVLGSAPQTEALARQLEPKLSSRKPFSHIVCIEESSP